MKGPRFLLSSESDWPGLRIFISETSAEFTVKEQPVHSTVKLDVPEDNSIHRRINSHFNLHQPRLLNSSQFCNTVSQVGIRSKK